MVSPSTKNTTEYIIDMNSAFPAVVLTSRMLFSPSFLESLAFTPTPVPTATAMSSDCSGNASETAVRASSLTLATNTESTML